MLRRTAALFASAFALAGVLVGTAALAPAMAQEPKRGGILRMYQRDNPPSASIHEGATFSVNAPFMGLYNNLVMYDHSKELDSFDTIIPELATKWAWGDGGKSLTFTLQPGVKWHDGKPFTAADVKCTFDLVQGKKEDKLRTNPRRSLYDNVLDVVPNGDHEVTLKLGRPQPSLLNLLASGYTPMYPCHVNAAGMRTRPIGTGPFKLAEFKQNEMIRLTRNAEYWKPGRPYLDGVEMPIITNRSTAMLAFISGKLDLTFPTEVTQQVLRDLRSQAPKAICHMGPVNVSTNLIVNRDKPPFDNADLRRAMALSLDRKAFNTIIAEGEASVGGTMLPQPQGVWGMPKEMLESIAGYGPDIAANRAEARKLMEKHGYGPGKRLAVKISTRNIAAYRDPAVILIDHLKEIYIDGELEIVETGVWFGKVARKDYAVGLNLTGNSVDDPDQSFFENYSCKSERNVTGYCNPELEKMFEAQSMETDLEKRKRMVWEIDRQLQEDVARPIILHNHSGTCWHPEVVGFRMANNASYNRYRFEDVWLNR